MRLLFEQYAKKNENNAVFKQIIQLLYMYHTDHSWNAEKQ